MNTMQTISTEQLAARLTQNPRFEFWNVLTNEYYSNELISGSRHVPLDQIGREVAQKQLPKNTEIIVYCAGVDCPQSELAVNKLNALGYMNAVAYEGGLEEWEAAGLSIEKSEKKAAMCH